MRLPLDRAREVFRCSEVFRWRVNTSCGENHLNLFCYFEPRKRCLAVWSRMANGRPDWANLQFPPVAPSVC